MVHEIHKITSENFEKAHYKTKFQFSVSKFTPISAKPVAEHSNHKRHAKKSFRKRSWPSLKKNAFFPRIFLMPEEKNKFKKKLAGHLASLVSTLQVTEFSDQKTSALKDTVIF